MKHTEGKWNYRLNPDKKERLRHKYWIDSDTGTPIAEVRNYENLGIENAEFIVRACNCHEELLAACKMAESLIRTARRYFPKSMQNDDKFTLENTCATIGKAIQKAEEGTP